MKRVLEVFGEPISRGGQESYVISTLENMELANLHVDMFTPYYCDNPSYVEYIHSIGGSLYHADITFKVGGSRLEIIPCFDQYLKINEKYDIVHIHSGSISVLAYYAQVAYKNNVKKVIVHSHSSGSKENIKHFLVKAYAAGMFKKYVTDFCACSMEAAKWKYPKSVLKNVKILKNGVDLNKFKFDKDTRVLMRSSYGIREDELVLGHVGRFTYEKNQTFLIDVLKEYIDRYGKAKMILVGDGTEIEKVKAKVKALRLEANVIFTGSKSNVNKYMSMVDIFLLPSLYEGLGIVGVEAQASGLSVIASTGVPTATKVSSNVFFVDLTSVSTWVDVISKCRNEGRTNNIKSIKDSGYDIHDSAQSVHDLYIND